MDRARRMPDNPCGSRSQKIVLYARLVRCDNNTIDIVIAGIIHNRTSRMAGNYHGMHIFYAAQIRV